MNYNELYKASQDVLEARSALERERERYEYNRRTFTTARANFRSARAQVERMEARVKSVIAGESLELRLVDARIPGPYSET
jgi:hypothetical protein